MPGEEDQDRIVSLGVHQPFLDLALKVYLQRTEMCLRLVVGDEKNPLGVVAAPLDKFLDDQCASATQYRRAGMVGSRYSLTPMITAHLRPLSNVSFDGLGRTSPRESFAGSCPAHEACRDQGRQEYCR